MKLYATISFGGIDGWHEGVAVTGTVEQIVDHLLNLTIKMDEPGMTAVSYRVEDHSSDPYNPSIVVRSYDAHDGIERDFCSIAHIQPAVEL